MRSAIRPLLASVLVLLILPAAAHAQDAGAVATEAARLAARFAACAESPAPTGPEAVPEVRRAALLTLAARHADPLVRANAAGQLAAFPDEAVADALSALVNDPTGHPSVQRAALAALVTGFGDRAVDRVRPLAASADPAVRETLLRALARSSGPRSQTLFAEMVAREPSPALADLGRRLMTLPPDGIEL